MRLAAPRLLAIFMASAAPLCLSNFCCRCLPGISSRLARPRGPPRLSVLAIPAPTGVKAVTCACSVDGHSSVQQGCFAFLCGLHHGGCAYFESRNICFRSVVALNVSAKRLTGFFKPASGYICSIGSFATLGRNPARARCWI